MPDEMDRAQERADQYVDDCNRERLHHASALPYTGHCHYCDETTGDGRRFCDVDCRDAYDHEQRLKKLNGSS